ncbi:hypothetical protein HH214_10845 [Mucilaginibacter robiniae]|uniref:Right-handed parallel beta-helix repeat-containing protein n=1 Tax=Mucilaginibacter robiniae TaxID=2728022 RepID=A0A7L5E1Q2_9SPHI|nr:hypothetical protein [Mucilaginibacter robiniae]QJD96327.1 hypothetical protein HH214_10845 [Mucilaginibacter robiniae]
MKLIKNLFLLLALGSVVLLSACHKTELLTLSQPVLQISAPITSDTLKGTIKGTLLSGKTYYFKSDITVNDGDTLQMQAGVKLIAIGDGKTYQTSPEIIVHGTFISLGTKDNPNYITVGNYTDLHSQAAAGNYANVFQGYWGGIVCSPSTTATATNAAPAGGDLIIKWTHLEMAGGPSGPNNDPAIYAQGDPRYIIYFGNIKKNFVLEDSWVFGSKDDAIRVVGGKINIMRNTFEICGQSGGEFFNMKSGTVGDIAYNMMIGAATNAIKASDSGSSGTQCNVNMYNNTIVNCGFRQTKSGRGGSINYEKAARGLVYNNLIVNCRFGLRLVNDADITNIKYNSQLYYGNSQTIVNQFNSADGVATFQSNDVHSTTPQQNNPLFISYDLNQFNYTASPGPLTAAQQPAYLVQVGSGNFRLQATSPAASKGKTDFQPLNLVTSTGTTASTVTLPGKDLGAYQIDGTGNQH